MKTLIYRCFISRKALASGSIHNRRLTPANAFWLIQPNRCNNHYLFNLVSGTLSLVSGFRRVIRVLTHSG